jgi:AICAR transformylase/IMP cyclohydrolase PurH
MKRNSMHNTVLLRFERLQANYKELQQAYDRLYADYLHAKADATEAQEIIEKLRVKLMLKYGEIAEACEYSHIIQTDRKTMRRRLEKALHVLEAAE